MHGRQKVERTLEEERKKEKERAFKLKSYKTAMTIIVDKRCKHEYDNELLQVIAQVLMANPDIGTLWNIRKEALLHIKEHKDSDEFSANVSKDLELTEKCLLANPKSYGAWHHRTWIMKETQFERVKEELALCAKYLQMDDRNFHCWDYRRYLLDNSSSMTPEDELKFTTEKIITNFSNYSSWHLRSTLLLRSNEDYLNDELDLIKNAAFTDPNDQSVWFYHRWLLKSQLPKETPSLQFVCPGEKETFYFVFNIPVTIPSSLMDLDLTPEMKIETLWSNPWNTSLSKLWVLSVENLPSTTLLVELAEKHSQFPDYFDVETKPKSSDLEQILRQELEWVSELNDIEPDIKWIISTLILLMRLINFVEYKDSIMEYVDKLMELDPCRKHYYLDLRSKYKMEWQLLNIKSDAEDVDLSNLGLTSTYYLERLCAVKAVNLTGNHLNEAGSLSALLNCERLTLQK